MMKKLFMLVILAGLFLVSCEKYDEDILPLVGVYEAHISGIAGPFSMNITSNYGDNVRIEAPWLDDNWSIVDADIDEKESYTKDIDIPNQPIGSGLRIYGEGVFQDYSIQIDYTIVDGNDLYHYTLVGTKL